MSAVADEAKRIEVELMREAFERTAVGLVVITPEGVFREVNRAFCEMLGYTEEELVGNPFYEFLHPDDVRQAGRLFQDAKINGASYFRFEQIGVAATMQRHGFAKARQSGLHLRLLSRLAPEAVDAGRQLEAHVLKHRSHLSN